MAKPLFSSDEEREQFYASLRPTSEVAPSNKTTIGEDLTDLYSSAAKGLGSAIYGASTFVAGNRSLGAEIGKSMEEYWQDKKTAGLKAQEEGMARVMADPNAGLLDVAGYAKDNPWLLANMLAESAPMMAAGAGAGGLVARGMASVGIMARGGILTTTGARVAAGVGEGLTLVPDVYTNTQGNLEAGLAGFALGVGTNMVTPGNLGEAVAKKMAGGVADQTLNAFNKSAVRRFGGAVAGEGAQEFVQEGGQALLEQAGTLKADGSMGDIDLLSAGKQAVVGAILGGVAGGGLHPLVGEGDPLKAKIAAQERALADRRAAAENGPNNPVLTAEVASSAADLNVLRFEQALDQAPEGPLKDELKKKFDQAKLESDAKAARLASERNPANRNLDDAADTAEGAAIVSATGGDRDTLRNVAAMAVASATSAVMQSGDIDSAISGASAGDRASSVIHTAATGIQNVARGVDQAITEASADIELGANEEVSKEEALRAEVEALRLRAQEAKTQTAETKLQREVESLRAQQAPKVEEIKATLPAETTIQMTEPKTQEFRYRSTPIAEAIAEISKKDPAARFTIEKNFEGGYDVLYPDGSVYDSYRMEQDAQNQSDYLNDKITRLADIEVGYENDFPDGTDVAEMQQQAEPDEAVEIRRGLDAMAERMSDTVAFDNGNYPSEIGDALLTFSRTGNATVGQMNIALDRLSGYMNNAYLSNRITAEQGRDFTALRSMMVDHLRKLRAEEVLRRSPQQQESENTVAELRRELGNIGNRLDGALSFDPEGYPTEVADAIATFDRGANTTPDQMTQALAVMSAYTNTAYDAGRMGTPAIARYGNVVAQAMPVIQNLRTALGQTSTQATESRSGSQQWPFTSTTSAQPAQAPARNIAAELRELEAEVDAEIEVEHVRERTARPRTEEGVRVVESNFPRRLERAKAEGTLTKLAAFWSKIMKAKGQRTLPKIKMNDLVAPTRAELARNKPIPQSILNSIMQRYNEALKDAAKKWAIEHNQRFDERAWINPIESISPYNDGAREGTTNPPTATNAGFSTYLRALNRTEGLNPYMVRADSPSAYFSCGVSIHAVQIQRAKGAADLAYRLAAEVANLRGVPFPSDSCLLTVNNLRRQLQSMSADTLFAPGTINPLTAGGYTSPQGMPADQWRGMTDEQRIGANALRAAHTITENRNPSGNIPTAARFLENLAYDRQGRIIAYRDPRTQNGFPRGTVVTDAMLDAKIGSVDPATGIRAYESDDNGRGGVGLSTAKLAILNNTILKEIEGDADARIPQWIETVARREGRKMNGWFFSEGEASGQGVSRDYATGAMNELLGETTSKILLDSGLVSFVESQDDLTGNTFSDMAGNIQGATTPDGKIMLVLENLTPRTFSAVLQHEALHGTLKNLVGEKTYNQLMSKLETLVQAGQGSTWAKEAEARVPSSTLPENRTEEIAAYAVEIAAKGEPETNPLVKWAKEFMSSIRAGILKSKLVPEKLKLWAMNNLQPQDLSKLALAGLQRRAQQGGLISRANGVRPSIAEETSPLRSADEYKAQIDELMVEHAKPETSRMRRAEINREVAQLRTAWRVADENEFEAGRNLRLSVQEEEEVSLEPAGVQPPNELNILSLSARGPFARLLEKLESVIVDKHTTINRIQRLAGVTAEQIRMDTMGALDRLGSRLMSRQKTLVNEPLARMENILTNAGWGAEDGRKALDDLLIAKHVAEYNAHIAEINPARYEMVDGKLEYVGGYDETHPGSGITDEEAAATIARLTGNSEDPKVKALLQANQIYREMIKNLQQYAVDQGLETQETIDNWNVKFPNYTPFNRDLNLTEDVSFGSVPGGRGFSLRAGLSRRAMGSKAEIVSPLVSTLLFGLKTTTRGENAEVGRTMLEFARNFTPKFRNEAGEWEPMFKVNTVQTQRVVKHVNVYRVTKADGTQSQEFYNRERAQQHANAQQALWESRNPNGDPRTSGVRVERVGDTPLPRVVVQPVPNQLNQDNVMVVPEAGQSAIIEFNRSSKDAMRILNAFKGATSSKELNKLLMLPRMFSRWVQATATGYNPVFAVFNSARDIQAAMVTIGADNIPGWTTADSRNIAKLFPKAAAEIWKQSGKEFRALHSNETIDTTPVPGSFGAWMKDAEAFGGLTGVRSSIYDVEDAETQIRRLFGQSELDKYRSPNDADDFLSKMNGIGVKIGDTFSRFGEGETNAPVAGWISKNLVAATARLNESTELATRTVVFKLATEKFMAAGKSEQEAKTLAANIAKNVSTNFNRRGEWSAWLNQLFPFFNAAAQGTARVAESLFEKETYTITKDGAVVTDERTKLSSYGKTVIGSLVTLGGLQAALLAMAGFEDDEPPKYVRERNFIIPFGAGNYLTIPMPHGLNTLINFGRETTTALMNPKKAIEHIANALWQLPAFNPFGSTGNTITDFSPAIMDPFISLYMNRDAFDRPIAKEDRDPANPTPGFTRAKEGASSLGRTLAQGINAMFGGNDDRKGFISPTPDQIDFVLGQVTGGVGREIGKAVGAVGTAVDMAAGRETEPMPSYKKPLIGRLVGNTQEPAVLRSKVFDIRQEINQTYAEYKGMRDRRETEEAREFWNAHPELKLRDDFERAAKQDSKMRKSRAVARNAGEISSVNKMTNQQDERLLKLVGRYKELKAD